MVEQDIEKKAADELEASLKARGVDAQVIAALSPSACKGFEEDKTVILTVKATPRAYATATIPTCEIRVEATTIARADADSEGTEAEKAFDAVSQKLEEWQKCYDETHDTFSFQDFSAEGFRLDGGEFSVDAQSKIWSYSHAFTVMGVIR